MAKRTTVDFSKHKLKVTKFDGVLIHELKIPNSLRHAVTFINAAGVMTVTGDFGNWVFDREFHPDGDKNSGVSDDYWDEKLEKKSVQKSQKYDKGLTLLLIDDFKQSLEEENQSEDERENDCDVESWISELEQNIDDEIEYSYILYRQTPNEVDCESLPYGEKRHVGLSAVYDAFDFICDLLKVENKNNKGKANQNNNGFLQSKEFQAAISEMQRYLTEQDVSACAFNNEPNWVCYFVDFVALSENVLQFTLKTEFGYAATKEGVSEILSFKAAFDAQEIMQMFNLIVVPFFSFKDKSNEHNDLLGILQNLPENRPLCKSSAIFCQNANESFFDFTERVFGIKNNYMNF